MDEVSAEVVSRRMDGTAAILTISNPPVNALSHAVRDGLMIELRDLRDDTSVDAVILTCAGRTFCAGADISEFDKPTRQPDLSTLIAELASFAKPTLAALHGTTLGGGLELALACRFRVAHRTTRLGFPEVKLGLIPGAGGTVRLPRLIDPGAALEMITTGRLINADEAEFMGLVDAVTDDGVVSAAIEFTHEALAEGKRSKSTRDSGRFQEAGIDWDWLEQEKISVQQKARGLLAPVKAAETLIAGLHLPFEEALANERSTFELLKEGEQSRAQRYLFFAEKEAAKVSTLPASTLPRSIETVGVIGAGTMGRGIAMALANGGISVLLHDADRDALERGLAGIRDVYASSVKRGSLNEDVAKQRVALITSSPNVEGLAQCDLLIEAAFEDKAVKRQIFETLNAVAKSGAIFATNTSYLDPSELGLLSGRPADMIGLHFFSPAHVMKLLEVVRTPSTAPDVVATALSLARTIGKIPVVVGICHGFVGNRMLAARTAELEQLLLEGATPQGVDRAFTEFGWPMGPFQMADLAGLDISWRNRRSLGKKADIADTLCERGQFGQKAGMGYYDYRAGPREPQPNAELVELTARLASEKGVDRRRIETQEICERTLFPMVNEGLRILDEGIVARESDIDVVWANGYGFPRGKGGPMFWARTLGYKKVAEALQEWHSRTGREVFRPSSALSALK
ncbi:3-hydroxyacyl-CoA dehydrogenase NAD-binding domain-containing protein [Mesorhizobium sp. RP14(2022)]|uniref:3-hydroxyacyl-CoA dehydrogenase NAD-binding domain-containing protein n=1 Tax=Mesorhizobium liriopis TaxID=2953882 RepID=A0ABT1C3M6_9HYPH|nr:3-hydroxyacyl-CoA dehydrogenase NAD-binding domain-containing protein [Mesorhizobium liriopis]MCO6049258.1 3-hydroxyacyl-CoA dehydrogenase NAD-binding domain-containing protein [Mesorhizobium liriopis]